MRKLTKVVSIAVSVMGVANLTGSTQASPVPPSRRPVAVLQNGARTHLPGSPYWGPNNWGSRMSTSLKVVDNQSPQGLYGLGKVHESFYGLSVKTACPTDIAQDLSIGAARLNDYGRNGTWDPNNGDVNNGIFTDYNFSLTSSTPTSPTANTGNDQWFTATQHWHIQDCPGTPYALPAGVIPQGQGQLDLNTHDLDYRQTYYTRTPGF